ncbi:c-type cytochrome [Parasphingorhabdus halotolerans]|uniref:Cytochrome c family protein n=1 Tax=Parasphingorhabdus halotolerans TaxID=2725558 RepID=A0A6H2DLJ1_9SPHN|nr:cytochrome c family protein [Parasphingorhabdus halotolerans]QJB69542.1 cytochrome c family protein [Parasphingorhabdus halotolerans]
MDNNNTIAGWLLFGFIAVLGFSIASSKYFHADKHERPEVMGYVIEGVETGGGADAGPAIETLLQTADVAAGEKVFSKCAACHTINSGGANGIGPNLYASMGKPHGHVAGFAYSDALKSIPGNWDWTSMNEWLTSPRKYAAGTKMTFAGLGKAEDRANLMAYLNAQGSNLPLPAAPTAAEAPAEGAVDAEAPAAAEAAAVATETAEANEAAATE